MRIRLLIILIYISFSSLRAQQYSFENGSISPFSVLDPAISNLQIVDVPYKDFKHALEWSWTYPNTIMVDYQVSFRNFRDGIIFWVYNENPTDSPLLCEFKDANNNTSYYFNFGLNFTGWRICRIGSKYMQGNKSTNNNLKLYISSPTQVNQGRLFIDRFSYVDDVNYQNAPDAQQPNNSETAYRIHWNSLWHWESTFTYDLALPSSLNNEQINSLNTIETALDQQLPTVTNQSLINNAKQQFEDLQIQKNGEFWKGAPLVVKPDKGVDDISLAELGNMMLGFAMDAKLNQNSNSASKLLDLWNYALDQGLAYGSSMGNNHHYGYEIRDIFKAAYMMRDSIFASDKSEEIISALEYWSGLAESRQVFDYKREGVVDTWNTLLIPRLISAMMNTNLNKRFLAVQSLIRWVDSSLASTPGNMGGLKPDGTIFHHAGHYPAYGVGAFAGLGDFISSLYDTDFNISLSSKKNLANSLLAMTQYTHTYDWSISMSGRHPFEGSINDAVIECIGHLALLGGIYNTSESVDSKLASEYLRLQTKNTSLKQKLMAYASAAPLPSGFFVFNHAAAGVHRFANNMVTIKGYNSDVWGSEIYTNDNRYGRYQSYGAIEIFNEGDPVSRTQSRFKENGWDWNHLPGTTSINLSIDLLESPISSTLMARSKEDFAGASAILNEYGVFGMKLWEDNQINNAYSTPNFKARKSVFAFGKRLICIGTGIDNSNLNYDTETTLFQQSINSANDLLSVNGDFSNPSNFSYENQLGSNTTLISDLSGNYYLVSEMNKVKIEGKIQNSKHNKTKKNTTGNFVTAVISHGKAPQNKAYEYMIMLKPTPPEKNRWSQNPGYKIIQADNIAHIVYDTINQVNALVCFEILENEGDFVRKASAESLIMYKQLNAQNLHMSVCDPSLHLPVKTKNSENTYLPSTTVEKEIIIDGVWDLTADNNQVAITHLSNETKITVSCTLGIPVEFELKQHDSAMKNLSDNDILIIKHANFVEMKGLSSNLAIYNLSGEKVYSEEKLSENKTFALDKDRLYLLQAFIPEKGILNYKLLL